MAKRFTDTEKYKKPFIRGLLGPYKLLWDYLYHDCDHAGIWIVDFEITQIYLGQDMKVDPEKALEYFNNGEERIIPFDDGKKWFIPGFIDFQYGDLNPENRAHNSVVKILKKYSLTAKYNKGLNKGLITPSGGCKDMVKDKYKDKVKEIVDFFNTTCGTKYKHTTKSIIEQINGRLDDGYLVKDFEFVIKSKFNDWKDNPKMREHITPHTLFRPSNFPKYLNRIKDQSTENTEIEDRVNDILSD
jgi:uncharacterized phage protein (TIGR02220 family)